ncbi:MAG: RagB/SusD family nutrient uptake outer membrane protein [Saprospiraceae bacterium]
MKRNKLIRIHISLFLAVIVCMIACEDKLNLESPQGISAETALSSDQGVKTALIGCYGALSGIWSGIGGIIQELLANDEDQIIGPFGAWDEIFTKNIQAENGVAANPWNGSYTLINRCNHVLNALEAVKEADRDRVEGEARFIRAAAYFDLVNFYGKAWTDGNPAINPGVPLVLTPTTGIDESSFPMRSTVAEVYERIIADLVFARDHLPEVNDALATTYVASGLLTRVFLMQEDFEQASQEASRVIDSGIFSLVDDFFDIFNQSENTSEDIFAIQKTLQDGGNDFIFFYAGKNYGGSGVIQITDTHVDKYTLGDIRQTFFYLDNFGARRTAKWLNPGTSDGNVNILRLAEMYLTRAECQFRLGHPEEALADVNVIRIRAELPPLGLDSLNLEAILTERSLELAFEGHAFRDTKRTRKNVGDISYNDDRLVLPIPQREIDLNPNLIQNPGY